MQTAPPRPVRRSILYGAAVGLLIGLAAVAWSGREGFAAIALWRNLILVGAVIGLVIGIVVAIVRRSGSAHHGNGKRDDPQDDKSRPPADSSHPHGEEDPTNSPTSR